MQPSKIRVAVAICALVLTGCTYRSKERPYHPDPRDQHIDELLNMKGSSKEETGPVVVSTHSVLARQPFQQEELMQVHIPRSKISPDDLTERFTNR